MFSLPLAVLSPRCACLTAVHAQAMEPPMQVCITALLAVAAPVHSSLPTPSPSTLLETAPAPGGQEANDTNFFRSDVFSPLLSDAFSPLLLPLSLES